MSKHDSGSSTDEKYGSPNEVEQTEVTRWQSFKDSFKSAEISEYDMANLTDEQIIAIKTARSPLARKLKSRHLQMIAIGGAIGTGLFVGSGGALSSGGPASLLIGFGIISVMLYCMMQSLGELSTLFPISGGFSTYTSRFIHPSVGFAVGWNYSIQWVVLLPTELIAGSITLEYFNSTINPVAFVAIFYVFIVAINIIGVKGYAEGEYIFSIIKVLAVIGFIIVGIVINCGGVPNGAYIGGKYWSDPGAFNHGFKGVCAVFVNAAFSFAGTEMTGLAAAETENPRKAVPKACKQVFWRIMLFYIVSLTVVGLIVPYDNERLLGGSSSVDITASPFVIAINNAGIPVLPAIMNVVILISVLSVGNASMYGSSRTLAALAEQGFAPKCLAYIDRAGRPMVANIVTALIGLLCFMSGSSAEEDVFNWLYALVSMSLIFTWGSVGICHLRFRKAMKDQGRSLDEVPYLAQTGIIGSWITVIINALVLVATFWTALWPIGEPVDVEYFFQQYLAVPIVIVMLIGHYLWRRPKWTACKDLDVDTGRRDVDLDLLKQELAEERAYIKSRPWWYRTWQFWC